MDKRRTARSRGRTCSTERPTRAACPGRRCQVALGSLSNRDPPWRPGETLSSGTPKCALIWKWGLCRWSQVKRRSFPFNPTIPSSRDTGLLMRRERYRDRFAWREDAARCRENALRCRMKKRERCFSQPRGAKHYQPGRKPGEGQGPDSPLRRTSPANAGFTGPVLGEEGARLWCCRWHS